MKGGKSRRKEEVEQQKIGWPIAKTAAAAEMHAGVLRTSYWVQVAAPLTTTTTTTTTHVFVHLTF